MRTPIKEIEIERDDETIPSCPLTTTISPLLAAMAAEGTITLPKLFH